MERPNGSPTFYALLEEMADIHNIKSHDYATNDNPYGNYEFAGQVAAMFAYSPADCGFAGRVAEKIYRIANLERGNKTPNNESLADTERDIATIVTLWMANRRDRRAAKETILKSAQYIPEPTPTISEDALSKVVMVAPYMSPLHIEQSISYLKRCLAHYTADDKDKVIG